MRKDLEEAKETINPPKQEPLDKGDVTESAHDEAAPLKPIGQR